MIVSASSGIGVDVCCDMPQVYPPCTVARSLPDMLEGVSRPGCLLYEHASLCPCCSTRKAAILNCTTDPYRLVCRSVGSLTRSRSLPQSCKNRKARCAICERVQDSILLHGGEKALHGLPSCAAPLEYNLILPSHCTSSAPSDPPLDAISFPSLEPSQRTFSMYHLTVYRLGAISASHPQPLSTI